MVEEVTEVEKVTKDGANEDNERTPSIPLKGGGLAGHLLRYSAHAVTMNILAAKYGRNGNKDPLGPHA